MKRVICSRTSNLTIRDSKWNVITIDELCDESFYNEHGRIDTFSGVQVRKDNKDYCTIYKSIGSGYQRGGDTELVITSKPRVYLYYCEFYHNNTRKRFRTIEDIKSFLYTI